MQFPPRQCLGSSRPLLYVLLLSLVEWASACSSNEGAENGGSGSGVNDDGGDNGGDDRGDNGGDDRGDDETSEGRGRGEDTGDGSMPTSLSGAATTDVGPLTGESGGESSPTSSGEGDEVDSAAASTGDETSGTGGEVVGRPPRDGALRIMPLGDSITEICGYRPSLWQVLDQEGFAFDFVGTSTVNGDCGVAGTDSDHEGHAGYLVTEVATTQIDELRTWAAVAPDLVLMHFGTNDIWNNIAVDDPATVAPGDEILDAYDIVVDEMRAQNPDVWFVVAQIIPMAPDESTCQGCTLCTTCPTGVLELNAAIPGWAAQRSTVSSPILVVDQFAGFDVVADTTDRVHPNASGAQKMVNHWHEVLVPLF